MFFGVDKDTALMLECADQYLSTQRTGHLFKESSSLNRADAILYIEKGFSNAAFSSIAARGDARQNFLGWFENTREDRALLTAAHFAQQNPSWSSLSKVEKRVLLCLEYALFTNTTTDSQIDLISKLTIGEQAMILGRCAQNPSRSVRDVLVESFLTNVPEAAGTLIGAAGGAFLGGLAGGVGGPPGVAVGTVGGGVTGAAGGGVAGKRQGDALLNAYQAHHNILSEEALLHLDPKLLYDCLHILPFLPKTSQDTLNFIGRTGVSFRELYLPFPEISDQKTYAEFKRMPSDELKVALIKRLPPEEQEGLLRAMAYENKHSETSALSQDLQDLSISGLKQSSNLLGGFLGDAVPKIKQVLQEIPYEVANAFDISVLAKNPLFINYMNANETTKKSLFGKLENYLKEQPTASQINEHPRPGDQAAKDPLAPPSTMTSREAAEVSEVLVSQVSTDILGRKNTQQSEFQRMLSEEIFNKLNAMQQATILKFAKEYFDKKNEEAKAIQKAEKFQADAKGLADGFGALANIGQATGSQALYVVGTAGASMAMIVGSAVKLAPWLAGTAKFTLSMLTPVGAIVGGVLAIFSLFRRNSGAKRLLQAIQQVSEQISDLHRDMNRGFHLINAQLRYLNIQVQDFRQQQAYQFGELISIMTSSFDAIESHLVNSDQQKLDVQFSQLESSILLGNPTEFFRIFYPLIKVGVFHSNFNGIWHSTDKTQIFKIDPGMLAYYAIDENHSLRESLPHWVIFNASCELYIRLRLAAKNISVTKNDAENIKNIHIEIAEKISKTAKTVLDFLSKKEAEFLAKKKEIYTWSETIQNVLNQKKSEWVMLENQACRYETLLGPKVNDMTSEDKFWNLLVECRYTITSMSIFYGKFTSEEAYQAQFYRDESHYIQESPPHTLCPVTKNQKCALRASSRYPTKSIPFLLGIKKEGQWDHPQQNALDDTYSFYQKLKAFLPPELQESIFYDLDLQTKKYKHLSFNGLLKKDLEKFLSTILEIQEHTIKTQQNRLPIGSRPSSSEHQQSENIRKTCVLFLELIQKQKAFLSKIITQNYFYILPHFDLEPSLKVQMNFDTAVDLRHNNFFNDYKKKGEDGGTGFSIVFETPEDFHHRFLDKVNQMMMFLYPKVWNDWKDTAAFLCKGEAYGDVPFSIVTPLPTAPLPFIPQIVTDWPKFQEDKPVLNIVKDFQYMSLEINKIKVKLKKSKAELEKLRNTSDRSAVDKIDAALGSLDSEIEKIDTALDNLENPQKQLDLLRRRKEPLAGNLKNIVRNCYLECAQFRDGTTKSDDSTEPKPPVDSNIPQTVDRVIPITLSFVQ